MCSKFRGTQMENELGPLPNRPSAHVLEDKSFVAFQNVLSLDRFIVHDARVKDYGIDVTLELCISGQVTNFKCEVQIKGKSNPRKNVDGSWSLEVETSNLNYLLNGAPSIYVCYDASSQGLRFTWAGEEESRIKAANPTWQQQESVTLHFVKLLDEDGFKEIEARVATSARRDREIRDTLGRATMNEKTIVQLDAKSHEVINRDFVFNALMKGGLSLISSGASISVLNAMSILSQADLANPRILVVKGYAQYSTGKYFEALGTFQQCLLKESELSEDDRIFMYRVRDTCELQIGRIHYEEYNERLNSYSSLKADQQSDVQLELLRQKLREALPEHKQGELLDQLRALVGKIEGDSNSSESFRALAKLALLNAEGEALVFDFTKARSKGNMKALMGLAFVPTHIAFETRWKDWCVAVAGIVGDTSSRIHPIVRAEAFLVWAKMEITMMFAQYFEKLTNGKIGLEDDSNEIISKLRLKLDQSISIFEEVDQLEGKLRAQLMLADALMLVGSEEEARTIAVDVLHQAEIMEYADLIRRAREFVDHNTNWELAQRERLEKKDEDVISVNESDDDLRSKAAIIIDRTGLPRDRFPVILKGLEGGRIIARARLEWCEQLSLLEDLRHTLSPETLYARDPDQAVHCVKLRHESLIGSTDVNSLIAAFKATFCVDCQFKSPKNSNTTLSPTT